MLTTDRIELFLSSLSENAMSQNTIRAYRADLNEVLRWADRNKIYQTVLAITNDTLFKEYVNTYREQLAPTTVKRKVSAFRAYGRWNDEHLMAGYRVPKPARPVPHPLVEGVNGVLEMIQECVTPEHRALIALCGLAGLRVSESRSIRAMDIDPITMVIGVHGKGDKWRTVPMSRACWAFLKPLYDAAMADQQGYRILAPLPDRTARAMITRMGYKAALSRPVKSHDLRATFATAVFNKTRNLRIVQELLGHASSTTSEVYTGVLMDEMRTAVEVI
jgi:site-specific recombinase XerD